MDNIQFEEQDYKDIDGPAHVEKRSTIGVLLEKIGIRVSDKALHWILVLFIALCIVSSVLILVNSNRALTNEVRPYYVPRAPGI